MGGKVKKYESLLINFFKWLKYKFFKWLKFYAPKLIIVEYYNFSLRSTLLNSELKLMIDHFRNAKLYQRVSRIWLNLIYTHIKQIVEEKPLTDITKNYCIRINDLSQFRSFQGNELGAITDQSLLCTVHMHEYVKKHFGIQGLKKAVVSEGSLVDYPQLIEGFFYSQSSLQTVCEIEWVRRQVSISGSRVLEIGAGYGRLAQILFSAGGGVRQYVIVDIPPALFISQSYLTSIAQKKRVFKFRPFKDFKGVQKEFNEAQIVFITPDQLKFLPDSMFEIAIGINCFQEIITAEIKDYFKEINRLAKYLYIKAMDVPQNYYKESLIPLVLYPIPQHWKLVDSQISPFSKRYSEVLYKTGY